MKNNILVQKVLITLVFAAGVLMFYGAIEGDGKKSGGVLYKNTQESGKVGGSYRMNVNNINLPFNTNGTTADVNIEPDGTTGRLGGIGFLYSGGFMISGYSNNVLWACAQATASRINNFVPGRAVPLPDDDAQMYVILKDDPAFGEAWRDWIDAVALGADYYNGDGIEGYDPKDLIGPNGEPLNGLLDPWEDAPDILGDATAWCLFTDRVPAAQRELFPGIGPQGIEIRQTVFAFASAGALGNIIFIRYRLLNAGTVAESLDSVIFSIWADPDLGDHLDDLVGVDVATNAGFTYQNTPDAQFGINPPCFMIDFFSGPAAFIATGPDSTFTDLNGNGEFDEGEPAVDSAYINRGQLLGITIIPGATNLPMSSFVHYQQSDPTLGDPDNEFQARSYMTGRGQVDQILDPCEHNLGEVRGGVDCSTVDPRFWYSGDPVTNVGWINVVATDQRQMQNTGPFQLKVEEEVEIVVAYVVGQGSDALSSITVARDIDVGAQFIFDQNFAAPSTAPAIQLTVETGEEFIDFVFPVYEQVSTENTTEAWDLRFQGINVYTYRTNSTQLEIDGIQNKKLFTRYSLDNFIQDVYKENPNTGGIELLYEQGTTLLDPEVYSDEITGLIRLRINQDPWTGERLVKGRPYYFSFTSYLLNYLSLVNKTEGTEFGEEDDYFLAKEGFVGAVENIDRIFSFYDEDPDGGVKLGEDMYNPPRDVQPTNKISGVSTGEVVYDVLYKDSLQTAQYEVTFFKDSSLELYQMFWDLTNINTNTLLLDSSSSFTFGTGILTEPITEGFITRVEEQHATIGTPEYEGTQWFTDFYDELDPDGVNDGTGITYVGKDILSDRTIPTFPGKCEIITVDRLRRVELRFGSTSKAYRYINGYLSIFASNTYRYAAGLTPADTVGKGPIGNWDDVNDRPNGWVDVPFTAWIVDDNFGVEEQLAVGFVERKRTVTYPNGTPDGVWDPTTDLLRSGEIILIFDSPYDPNGGDNPYDPNSGGQIEFTGGAFSTPGGEEFVWADLTKTSGSAKDAPEDATNITEEQRTIFNSKWFNTLYVVGFQRDTSAFYSDGDKLIIPVSIYPYTENDVYQFTLNGTNITDEQERDLWNKVNVFPNPLYGFNEGTGYSNSASDEPFVTFNNLPSEITVKIYSLSGLLLRTLKQDDKQDPSSPFLRWDLENESGLRVASGMYLAIVSSQKYGDKVLKFGLILPQKQIQKF